MNRRTKTGQKIAQVPRTTTRYYVNTAGEATFGLFPRFAFGI